jgi:hypothetical protein
MDWIYWLLTYAAGFFLAIYVISTVVLALSAKFEKGKNGKLRLDAQSWHFKIAFPVARYENGFGKSLKRYPMNSCRYRQRFAHGLFLIWPLLILLVGFGYLCLGLLGFLFRHYPKFTFAALVDYNRINEFYELPGFSLHEIKWLSLGKYKIYPLIVLVLGLYLWNLSAVNSVFVSDLAMTFYPLLLKVFLWIVCGVVALIMIIGVIVGVIMLFLKIRGTDKKKEKDEKVSVVWVSIKSRYKKLCYQLDVYNIPEDK